MNHIANLLDVEHIALDLPAPDKHQALAAAARLFARDGLDPVKVQAALAEREQLGSTGIGEGVAIPHGRLKGLASPRGAFVRLAEPVPFDACDGRPVRLVFVLLVPEQATEEHLQILSELAERFSDPAVRQALTTVSDPESALGLLTGTDG
ncbi:PTS sugar transporter subunit IIA [Tepidiphilus margaritifer]|uniref:PTS sugar transporter subunit IIA n=1 Tax=Tepidiphilus margaritifer TaxID=203471 RepID=UPI0004162CD1|nr:PTS sugar transporter subunit IIA [Tepidiphilus margaritifer]